MPPGRTGRRTEPAIEELSANPRATRARQGRVGGVPAPVQVLSAYACHRTCARRDPAAGCRAGSVRVYCPRRLFCFPCPHNVHHAPCARHTWCTWCSVVLCHGTTFHGVPWCIVVHGTRLICNAFPPSRLSAHPCKRTHSLPRQCTITVMVHPFATAPPDVAYRTLHRRTSTSFTGRCAGARHTVPPRTCIAATSAFARIE